MQNQGGWPPNQNPYPQPGEQPPGGSFGSPGYGYGAPIQPHQAPYQPPFQPNYVQGSASGRAVASLILAIASWVACSIVTGIPAIILARSELQAIERGEAPYAGKGLAQAAFWVGLINLAFVGLIVVAYVVFFALALSR